MVVRGVFAGGFQYGAYGHLVPYDNDAFHDKGARFNLATFSEVQVLNVAASDEEAKFHGGFQDGTYGYLVPFTNGAYHGKVARFNMASFSDVQVLDLPRQIRLRRGFMEASRKAPTATSCPM